ncbi:MAG: heme lyase CcmF/NrfE family subunit [Betaproteobacteria bacterium]|nr:heme lyase CcmF/NrfE family subunit [Betaproteobacteria bacterium]
MIPEFGQFALALAFTIALVLGILPLVGAVRGDSAWMSLARPAAQGQLVFVAIAFGCLTYAFVTNDFTVAYVANNSNSKLPLVYRIAGVWGGHEGSLLLWMLMLSLWMVAVTVFSRYLPEEMVARVLGVMGLVSVGFLAFMLFTSNPFDRLLPAPPDGRDLNPLLQDPGMVLHPPMLYMGYVGFSVAFAFAIAALISGRLDAAWARWSRPWTTVAWAFLTLGIALGSAWAYYELGWGGWWFWDPVENSSFMPWLIGTALIHSLAVTEKRGSFRSWTVLLAIFTFAFSLLGTFLVRSGVLTSVHAFASDPRRGIFILGFLALVIGGSLALFAWRTSRVGLGGSFDLVSRESMLLTNNVLLAVACGSVMLGTLYPLVLEVLGLGKISVGSPYFDTVFVPLMAPALFLMGVGPIARWKKASLPELAVRLRWAFAVSLAAALLLPFTLGSWKPLVSFGLMLALWIVAASAVSLRDRVRHAATGGNAWRRLTGTSRTFYGMVLAHVGMAVFVVGVTLVKGYESEKDVRMETGDTVEIGGYTFRFDGVAQVAGPNYKAARATMQVTKNGKSVVTLYPEKRIYAVQPNPMTEAAIDPGFTRDLYVALGDELNPTTWVVRVHHKPFVSWIWGGWLLMALGGLLAASDRRYRVAARGRREEQYAAAARGPQTVPASVKANA